MPPHYIHASMIRSGTHTAMSHTLFHPVLLE